jgi:hypothetical protein
MLDGTARCALIPLQGAFVFERYHSNVGVSHHD